MSAGAALPVDAAQNDAPTEPSPLEWIAAVGAIVIQQSAFIYVPTVLSGLRLDPSTLGTTPNPVNTVAVAANGLAIGALCLIHSRQALSILRGNWAAILLAFLVVASTIWSIHPEITIRRAGGYLITILTAVFLSSKFTIDTAIRALSWGLALSAIGSFAFVAAYPQYGIMRDPTLEGTWRGVFTAKNPMGFAMCIGVFIQCYIIAGRSTENRRNARLWDICLLAGFSALVVLSRSATAILCSAFFLVAFLSYVLWIKARAIAIIAATATVFLFLLAAVAAWLDPVTALSILGKDATLTGRTGLWPLVLDLIIQKPILGWGYQALWLAEDKTTVSIATAIGWTPPSAHNLLLQIASELGVVGVTAWLAVIAVALWRGASCIIKGRAQLGFFLLIYVVATVTAGVTEEMLGENQTISWLVFNVLVFSAGLALSRIPEQNGQPLKAGRAGDPCTSETRWRATTPASYQQGPEQRGRLTR